MTKREVRRLFDGLLMGNERGTLFAIYEPRWWQLRRWWRWWRTRERGHVRVTIGTDKPFTLRAVVAPLSLTQNVLPPDTPVELV
jgi:hypothetical protein